MKSRSVWPYHQYPLQAGFFLGTSASLCNRRNRIASILFRIYICLKGMFQY